MDVVLLGSDLSRNNGPDGIEYALKQRFCIVKATEGNGHPDDPNCVDPQHDSIVAALRKAHILVGHYHVCHPENDPVAEAEWFVKYAKPQPGDTMWADFEPYYREWSATEELDWLDWLNTFIKKVTELTDATCGAYLNNDMARRTLSGHEGTKAYKALVLYHPLWKSELGPHIGDTFGFLHVLLWQYDQTDVDKNKMLGDEEVWQAVAVPQEEADMGFQGPQYDGYPVFGYPRVCRTEQIEGFVGDVLTQAPLAGTSVHILEYDVISNVHGTKDSWHYWFDNGHALAADVNLYGCTEPVEFQWLLENVFPLAKKWGLAVTFPADTGGVGVAGHSIGDGLHLHVDVGSWSNTGTGDARFVPWNRCLEDLPDSGVVRKGDTGPAVVEVQKKVGVPHDGVFGDVTEKAVKALQRLLNFVNKHNVDVDGAWGPVTDAAYKAFCDGDFGEKTIRLWQHNAGTPVDGVINAHSTLIAKVQRSSVRRKKVRAKYRLTGREVDGILGPATWKMVQDWLGVKADGVPGPVTIKALQRRLLRGGW